MNILILSPKQDRIDLSLRVGASAPVLALEGHVCGGTPAVAELRDQQGTVLHRLDFTGDRLAAGLVSTLSWLRERNIRVDVAVPDVAPLVPNDLTLRLSEAMKGILAGAPANQARESVKAVTAWDTACPQFVHYAIDPENLDNLVSAVNNACATPPSYCRRNRKVSLRRLYRVTREIERQTMKKLIFVALLGTAPLAVLASQEGCGPACLANATAVFRGPTQYTMTVDNAQHAHIAVTWEPKHHTKLKPVRYEGTAPVRLRHTTVHTVEFPHDDVCNAVVTIVEAHQIDDNFDVYQVPMHNTQCN